MNFAERLQKLMNERGITSYRLAKEIGCTITSVTNWLSGKDVSKTYITRMADYFDVSTDYLLTGEQKEKAAIDMVDDDLREYLDELRNRPEQRMLFSVTKNATKAQIEAIVKMVEEMQKNK